MNEKTFNEDCVRKAIDRINSAKVKVGHEGAGRGRHAPNTLLVACTVRLLGAGQWVVAEDFRGDARAT